MAGGPVFPNSMVAVTAGVVFPNVHIGAGANSKHDEGLGVAAATLTSDGIWRLRFAMPPTSLPTGTGKLRLLALANATSGSAKVNPKWASVAAGASPSGATLSAEGTNTLTWASGDNDKYKELKITLAAATLTVSQIVVMDLTFETSGFDLAAVSTWRPSIIWE